MTHGRFQDAGLVQIGARDRQHIAACIDANRTAVMRSKQFQYPPRARSKIEQGIDGGRTDQP